MSDEPFASAYSKDPAAYISNAETANREISINNPTQLLTLTIGDASITKTVAAWHRLALEEMRKGFE